MKNRVAILAGVVWHQYAKLVFSKCLEFKSLQGLDQIRYRYRLQSKLQVKELSTVRVLAVLRIRRSRTQKTDEPWENASGLLVVIDHRFK